jgi:asparagine synthase (glutamine-hydrolysing)
MCGIAGILDRGGRCTALRPLLGAMGDSLRHRGPNDEGIWTDDRAAIGLVTRRLAIQDLSPAGHQPLTTADGRWTIAFNGEIYNVDDLRRSLGNPAPPLRGRSDTEALAETIASRGLREALDVSIGMFAFALWDAERRELTLVRDRLGVKPLYVGLSGDGAADLSGPLPSGRSVAFASELKALRRLPWTRFDVDPIALGQYMRHAYVPMPRSIHPSIAKLPPGHMLTIGAAGWRLERYWSARETLERATPFRGSDDDALDELSTRLDDAVRLRLVSDVPTGVFLSSGVDSLAVLTSVQRVANGSARAFTIALDDPEYDESAEASSLAAAIGASHETFVVAAADAIRTVPTLPEVWDEPFADSSQIVTYCLARETSRRVTVALSGDGGDELFGGYERYRRIPALWRWMRTVPHALRAAMAPAMHALTRSISSRRGERAFKLAPLLASVDMWDAYRRVTAVVPAPEDLLTHCPPAPLLVDDPAWVLPGGDGVRRMMQADIVSYLVDDILVKVDRATMAHGLEAREPLLDHRLFAFACSLPMHLLIRDSVGKWALRQVVAKRLQRRALPGRKVGFAVPLARWLRGPLRDWVESLIEPRALRDGGRFRPEAVRGLWESLLAGRRVEHQLWTVLMFLAWEARWRGPGIGSGAGSPGDPG